MKPWLEVIAGPLTGDRIPIPEAPPVIVGRSALATVRVPDDNLLSGRHFSLTRSGGKVVLRDLESTNHSFVNGTKVTEAVLREGDEIAAGACRFRVHLTGSREGHVEDPLSVLRAVPGNLFAILDAARDPLVLGLLRESGQKHGSLYEGEKGKELDEYAPYLVSLGPDSPFLETLLTRGWGQSWGVFLNSPEPFEAVRRHLRKFLMVKLPEGRQVYFRFYDPRVLRVFLPTCTREEQREFFGPLGNYWTEPAEGRELLRFSNAGPAEPQSSTAIFQRGSLR